MAKRIERASTAAGGTYRSAVTGRYVTRTERVAAARARVSADKKRNVKTEAWIVELSRGDAPAGPQPR